MKTMKKMLAMVLAIATILSSTYISVGAAQVNSADSADAVITLGDSGENYLLTSTNDEVVIPVNISFNSETAQVNAFLLTVDYDSTNLELTEITDALSRNNYGMVALNVSEGGKAGFITSDADGVLSKAMVEDEYWDGFNTLFWLKFKAKEGYVPNDCSVSLSLCEGKEANFSYSAGNVTDYVDVYFKPVTIKLVKPGVTLDKTEVTVDGTNGGTVSATVIDSTGEDVTASSILTVSPAGSGVTVNGNTITVDAKAKADTYTISYDNYTANLSVNRVAEGVASVTVSPASATIVRPKAGEDAATQTFTATVYNQYDEVMSGQSIQWSATDGTITDGVLTIDHTVAADEYTVTATVSGVSGTANVTVTEEHNKFPTTVVFEGINSDSVTVTAPVAGETVLTYTATVYDQYGDLMPANRNYSTKYVAGRNITIDVDNDQNPVVFTVTIPAGCGTRENTLKVEDTEISLYVKDIEFGFEDAYSVNSDRTYGKTWGELITIGEITATLNGNPVEGTYSLSVDEDAVPTVGEYPDHVNILFSGSDYTNVVVDTVTYVKVKEAGLTNVTANVEGEIVYIVNSDQNLPVFTATTVDGSNVTVTYGEIIGDGASYFDYDAANGTIKVKDGTTDEADGQTATIPVTISAPNHTSVERTITVNATKKNEIAVDFNNASNQTYTPNGFKLGNQFVAASVPADYTAEITYSYNGQTYTYDNLCDVTVTNADTYTVTAYYEDYSSKGSSTATFTIDKADVTEPTAQTSLVYNGSEQTGVEIAADALYALAEGSSNKGTNADSYTTNLTLKDTANYKWADGSDGVVEWSIARKPIAVPAAVTGLVYTGTVQIGVEAGEGYTLSDNTATNARDDYYIATATPDSNHVWTDGTSDAAEIDWSIARKEITAAYLSAGTVKVTKPYDGTSAAGTVTGSLAVTGANGETLALAVTEAGAYSASNVGTYNAVLTLGSLQNNGDVLASNYKLAGDLITYTFAAAAITPADYSYTVTNQQIKAGGGLSKLTYPATANGVGSETLAGTFGWYTDSACTVAATDTAVNALAAGDEVTLYWQFAPSNENVNYDITPKTGSITVTIIEGDPQNASFASATLTKTYGDDAFTNPLTITSGEADITSIAASRTNYTSSDSSVATVDAATGEVTILAPGTTTITADVAKVEGEYAAGSASYTLTVEQKQLDFGLQEITVTKVYDGTTTAATVIGKVTFVGEIPGDDVAITAVAGDYADKNVGTDKTVPVTLTLTGADAGNYKLASTIMNYTTASITASDAVTDATAKAQNVVVGVGTFAAPTFTGIGGETVEGALIYTYNGAPADKADIEADLAVLAKGETADIAYTFEAAGNYAKTTVHGTITVTMVDILFFVGEAPATAENAVTVKADPTYGDSWQQIVTLNTITASVDGVGVDGEYTLQQTSSPDAGSNTFRVLFSDGNRYEDVVVVEGTVNVAKKAVTVTPDAGQSKIYGEADPTLTYTIDLTDATLTAAFEQAVNGTLSRAAGKNVGSYGIELGSLSAGGNFALTLSGTVNFSIEKKDVTISGVAAEDKTYDGSVAATANISAAVINGKVDGDDLSVSVGTAVFANKNAGTEKNVTFTGFGLSGNDAGNYNLTAQPAAAAADIAPKELAVVWTNTALNFNGSAQTPTAAVTDGIVDGDSVPLTVTGQQTDVGEYTAEVTTSNGNYTLTNTSTGFAIGKATAPTLGLDGQTTYKYTVIGEKHVAITGIPADAGIVSYAVGNVSGQVSALEGDPTAADGMIRFTLAPDAEDVGKTVSIPVTVTMGNYEDANVTVEIVIVEKDVPVLTAEDVTVDYTGTALTTDAIIGTAKFEGADVAGSWNWGTDMDTLINAGTYTAIVKFTPDDSINYAEVTKNVTITVNKVKVVVPSAVTGLTYNTSEQTGVVDGEYYSVTGNAGTNAGNYTATVTLDDSANYEWTSAFEGTIQWSIVKANPTGTPNFTKINSAGKTLADVTVDLSGMTPSEGTFKWVDADGNELESTTKVDANKAYKWVFTPADTTNYDAVSGTVVLYVYYVYVPSTPSTSTEITKNEDGSTTTTVTDKKTGTVTATTENVDGSTTVVETKKDGTVTETNTTADGVTGTTVTDAEGKVTEVTVQIPAKVAEAEKTVPVPVEVLAATSTAEAVEIDVTVPETVESVAVEIPVANVTPGSVVVIVDEDGSEEVVKKTNLTENGVVVTLKGTVTVKVVDNSKTFTDVDPDVWYATGVDFVSGRELYNGIGNDQFDPKGDMTRGMLVTVLHRMEDEMSHDYDGSFHDVADDCWYTDAIHWAADHNIVGGYGNGYFGTNDNITREQMITLVFRYLNWLGLDTSARGDLNVFTDNDEISSWAVEAMQWGVGVGIVNGVGNNLVDPESNATRAQVAVFMQRVIGLMY